MGSDALYVNFSGRQLYKVDILSELHENDFDSLEVMERQLAEFLAFPLEHGAQAEVFRVLELENESDVWKQTGR